MTKFLPALLIAALLGGCSTAPRTTTEDFSSWIPTLLDGTTGDQLTLAEVISQAAEADIVVIGELHGHAKGLKASADLFAGIVAVQPETTALGLEFYERDTQAHLDDYLAGITDEAAFDKSTHKPAEKDSHRPMIETARDAGLRVWALNAPRRYVRLARSGGFDAYTDLTTAQQRLVKAPAEVTTGRYADTFYELMSGMGGHDEPSEDGTEAEPDPGPSEMVKGFFRSQNVWDATMADTAIKALDAGARPLVIIVGQFHSDFGGGLVERLHNRAPGAHVLTVSVLQSDYADDDAGRADVLIATSKPAD